MSVARVQSGLVVASVAGLCLGALTVRWMVSFYPPTRDHFWPMVSVVSRSPWSSVTPPERMLICTRSAGSTSTGPK